VWWERTDGLSKQERRGDGMKKANQSKVNQLKTQEKNRRKSKGMLDDGTRCMH
jgi:hypothetical protein